MEDPEPLSFEEGPLYFLHCLKQLQSLVVTRIPLCLDDSLPAFFSSHWPSLTSLSFLSVADTFTLTTFYHLVVQCPHLQNVSVPFSVTEDPTLLFDLIYSPPNPPFDRPLVLRDACNELPSVTAALMYTSFPLVEFVGGQGLHAAALSMIKSYYSIHHCLPDELLLLHNYLLFHDLLDCYVIGSHPVDDIPF